MHGKIECPTLVGHPEAAQMWFEKVTLNGILLEA
jgi:hypothetical protein